MIIVIALFCIVFIVAPVIGWWCYRSFFWNWVDIIYYPLAAIAVMLLFVSNDIQRDLLEVTQLAEQQRSVLAELKTKKPDLKIIKAEALLDSNVDFIAWISKWADICQSGPSVADPRCLAVKNLGPPVQAFLKIARGNYLSYEDRLFATCTAGDDLLKNIQASQAISTLVMEKLIAQYEEAISLKLSPLDVAAIDAQANQFRDRATSYAERINHLAFTPYDVSGRLLLDINMAEIEYGELLLRGLSQCITSPKAELGLLNKWTHETSTQEQEVARLEALRENLKNSSTKHPFSLWLQLNLWPIVLLVALSLKFAKGAATLRKARSERPK